MSTPEDQSARLEALERQVALLSAEVASLRPRPAQPQTEARPRAARPADSERIQGAAERLYQSAARASAASFSGDQIESFVGRYGTLVGAALLILMAVGVLVEVAVARGFFTASVRVGLGALAAVMVGGAGLWFRRRGEVRYGDVLLSIALAIVDLVAWGAGPRLHIVSPTLALVVIEVVAMGIAALALHDDNEFLFSVAVGGALSAPFVTSTGGGTPLMLLSFGAAVLVSSLRAVRNTSWRNAFAVLGVGAAVYVLAAAALPIGAAWYEPYLIVIFAGTCGLAALLIAPLDWRGDLARCFLATGLLGVAIAWDRGAGEPVARVAGLALVLAVVTHAALRVRQPEPQHWVASAQLLPLLSLGVAYPPLEARAGSAAVFAVWAVIGLAAWRMERHRGELERGGAHLLSAGVLGALAIGAQLWDTPLALVAALGAWGVLLSAAVREESSPLPLAALAATLGAACLSAFDQLASRQAYAYTPFLTRSSASALCAVVAVAASAELIGRSDGTGALDPGLRRWADRPMRLGVVVGFTILWGRMELAHAFNRDLATFLLILYYAACGLATILAGRWLGVQRLRMAGLALALYAAVKAMIEVAALDGVAIRVGSYGAVGLFLLAAGYLYREQPGARAARLAVGRRETPPLAGA
jgi:uncharacterized membrane protein